MRRLRALRGLPHWIVLDEAHDSLHEAGVPDDAAGLDAKGFCLVTYRPSGLRASVLDAIDLFVFERTTAVAELAFLRAGDGGVSFVAPPRR